MICRIQASQTPEGCTIHVAGRLAGAHIEDLRGECAKATGHVRIDLGDLLSVDRSGLDALRRLADSGMELVGVAQYLQYELGLSP